MTIILLYFSHGFTFNSDIQMHKLSVA